LQRFRGLTFMRIWLLALFALWATSSLGSQALSLNQAVDAALASGADQTILQANLASAQAALSLAQARTGLTVTSVASYNASEAFNDPARVLVTVATKNTPVVDPLVVSVGSVSKDGVIPQNAQVSVTLATPLTSLTMRGTEGFQIAPDGSFNHSSNGTASVSQVLYSGYPGGSLQAALEKALFAAQVASLNAQANRNKLILSVKQAFYTLLSAQETMAQLEVALSQRREALRFTSAKANLGQATGLDLKTAQINLRSAELDQIAGQSSLDVARKRLANLMGRPVEQAFTAALEPDPAVQAASLEDAIQLALGNRVEPKVAKATAASAAVDAAVASTALNPSLNLTGSVNGSYDWQSKVSSAVVVLGLSLGLPVTDAKAAASQGLQAAAAQTVAQTQAIQLQRSIPVDVSEAWSAWKVSQQRNELALLSQELAEGQKQVVQAQFDNGLKNLSDLQASELALSTAALNLVKAKIAAQLAALQLQSLLGL